MFLPAAYFYIKLSNYLIKRLSRFAHCFCKCFSKTIMQLFYHLTCYLWFCVWQSQIFWRKKNCPKYGEIGLRWAGNRVFWIIKKFSLLFSLNLVYNESFYYLQYSCTNSIFGKNLVPEIWAKMLLVNQIAGFLNQLYL